MTALPTPSNLDAAEGEFARWNGLFAGEDFFYGQEPGPIARRAVRYHRSLLAKGGTALDAGCGEGQDLAFLAERGYQCTGLEWTPHGLDKTRRLLAERGQHAKVVEADLRNYHINRQFDLVLAVNVLQFLGESAPRCLQHLMEAVAPGGILGLSLFARQSSQDKAENNIFFTTLPDLLAIFEGWQPLEAAQLWQWNVSNGAAQPFVTLIVQRAAR